MINYTLVRSHQMYYQWPSALRPPAPSCSSPINNIGWAALSLCRQSLPPYHRLHCNRCTPPCSSEHRPIPDPPRRCQPVQMSPICYFIDPQGYSLLYKTEERYQSGFNSQTVHCDAGGQPVRHIIYIPTIYISHGFMNVTAP